MATDTDAYAKAIAAAEAASAVVVSASLRQVGVAHSCAASNSSLVSVIH
jgi:hypothetical protein